MPDPGAVFVPALVPTIRGCGCGCVAELLSDECAKAQTLKWFHNGFMVNLKSSKVWRETSPESHKDSIKEFFPDVSVQTVK